MLDKKIIEVENFEFEIESLTRLSRPIQSNFQAIVLDYINKISGKMGESPITATRSDILFRIRSILYFVKLIWNEEKSLLRFINENSDMHQIQRMNLSDDLVINQKAIFDSVLYHLGSLYDYYANMVGNIYYGKYGLKWNSLVKSAYDKSNSKIGDLQTALIIESHKGFVDALFSHRSYLIHKNMSHPGFKYTHNLGQDLYSIKVITPERFVNEFKQLKTEIGTTQISLKASLIWILKYGFTNLNKLLYGMKDEMERLRKLDKGSDVIQDKRYPEGEVSMPYWKEE